MNHIIALMCLLAAQLHKGISWDSEGTEFITAFMQNVGTYNYNNVFQLTVTALNPSTSVHVIIYNTSFELTLILEEWETRTVLLPSTLELQGTAVFSDRTVIIKSTKPITVVSINYKQYTADSSTIFPVNSLGSEYYVFAPTGYSNIASEFVIINHNQTNEIVVTLSSTVTYNGSYYQPGENLTITLSAFEAVQLQSSTSLTGTRVQSKYPVAVLSGNACATYNSACDIVFEQLIPVNDWGRTFLVSSIAVANYTDIVSLIASQTTDIQYIIGGTSNNITLQEGRYSEIHLPSNSFLAIDATKPIMVMYTYTGGSGNYSTDPFIMNVIPFESLSSSYVINTEFHVNNYVRVIAKMSALLEIFKGNSTHSFTPAWNSMNGTDYAWTDIALPSVNESFILQHCSSSFAVYIYGTGSWVGIGTTAPAINIPFLGQLSCDVLGVTVRSMTNGSVFVNWTNSDCVYSYLLTLTKSDNPAITEEKVVQGSSIVFTGPYFSSDYNLTIQAVIEDKQCIPVLKQFTHFGVGWKNEGTEFITAFMQNYQVYTYNNVFQLTVTALNPSTSVHVIIYNTSFELTLTLEEWETRTVLLPSTLELQGTAVFSDKTVIIKSTKPITVVSINYEQYTADSSTIFPVNSLGSEYYVFAPTGHYTSILVFVIINHNQANEILVTLTSAVTYNGSYYQPGENLTITLSAFEAVQLQSSASLTGTRVQSEYPVAVLSGNACATYNSACDIVFEQLIPLNDWGRTFLVSSVAVTNYADIVSLIASQTTDIQYITGGTSNNITLQEGKYSEIRLPSNSFLAINASQPIMVMYTFTGGFGNYPADPFIMNVIPFESFSSSYVINTEFHVNNYLRVIAKTSALLEIFKGNHTYLFTPTWNSMDGTNYAWTDIVLPSINESFILQHCSSSFAAYIYGTGSWVGIGTTAPAINIPFLGQLSCEVVGVTVRSMTNGSVFVNWTNGDCVYSYIITLTKSDNPAVVEEIVVQGSSIVFTGPYVSSDYNLTIQAVFEDKQCLPMLKQFTHFDFSWSSAGTEFITAFVQNYDNSDLQVSNLAITALSPSTSIQVMIYNTSFEAALTLGEGETSFVNIPAWAELRGTILSSNNAVIVRSDKPITVSSFSYKPATADSADIFPVDILGTEYYVFAPKGGYGMSEVAVINYNQTNELLMTVSGTLMYNGINYNSGDNITLVLSAFDVIQLQSTTILTGTRIQSEYPVAVLSGNSCDRYNGACDVMFEQLLPVNKWGKKFLVASIAVQGYTDIVTVVASQRTEISYSTGNWSNGIELHQGQSTTISLSSSSSLYLTATEPVMVMYTFTGGYNNWDTVDPFVMNILPFESFSSSYVINTENNFNNYIQLIAEASVISEILQSNNILSNASIQGNVPMSDYAWAKIELGQRNQSFIIKHCSAFAVYMFGTLSFTGFGTTALAINKFQTSNMTITYLTNGSILVTWPKGICIDSYFLQISIPDTSNVLEEKMVYENSAIFTGLQACTVYSATIWAMFEGEKSLLQTKKFTYFGLQKCKSFNMTVTFDYGYALVTWPIVGCVDSYFLQLSALDGYTTLQQQIVYGGSASFYGLQLCSSYNLTIQAMFQGENCLPLTQEFTYFGTHLCDSLDMTVTSLANGAIQANWTNIQCIDSYRLQLYKADTSTLLEQKIVNGTLVIFTGPYDHSVYNVILCAMYSDEQCPPVEKQITHFGKFIQRFYHSLFIYC
ncbi:uncharacterized protein LOC122795067 [Protopterus annectens]|uniref:uncharacterized protein LOC122795067 n=1 Tax=Protopterus annectens TaxID=7888 RepID=UPI001CF9DBB6|nr:uncharacterized protein LOC122795067 [Protopterus annectens]